MGSHHAPIDMRGSTRDGWTVVARAPSASYGARWRLRHADGRERVAGGLHLRRAGFPVPAGAPRRRGAPLRYVPGARLPVAGGGYVEVLARPPGRAVVRLACGCERALSSRAFDAFVQGLRRDRKGRCGEHADAARPRADRSTPCRWCPRRRGRTSSCEACDRARSRNGAHPCCGAPRRRTAAHRCGTPDAPWSARPPEAPAPLARLAAPREVAQPKAPVPPALAALRAACRPTARATDAARRVRVAVGALRGALAAARG